MLGPQPGKQSVTLSTFGGLVTEANPSSLSEGSSPLCYDVDFLVGSVFTRAGLASVYGAGVSAGNFIWVQSFVLPSGQIYTLGLDSLGNLWREDVTSAPGSLTLVESAPAIIPGNPAFGTTAFSRKYLCLKNDLPRQYDGLTNFDRVSQEGPAAPIGIQTTDTSNTSQATLTSYSITSDVVTFIAANSFSPGDFVQIFANGIAVPNGTVLTLATTSGTQFTAAFTAADVASTTITGTAVPVPGYTISSITQPAQQSVAGSSLWSSGPGSANAGTTLTIYYGPSSTIDPVLTGYVNQGLPVYVYLTFPPAAAPMPSGTYKVLSVGLGYPIQGSTKNYYFTVQAPYSAYVAHGAGVNAKYQITLATVTLSQPIPGVETGSQISIQGTTPTAWNNSWTVVGSPNAGVLQVTQTALSVSAGVATATYTYTPGTFTPAIGDLVTVLGSTRGNGIFNVINATVSGTGVNTFSVTNLPTQTTYTTAADPAQAQFVGTTIYIDPGPLYAGISNATSPIYGNAGASGYVIYTNTTLNVGSGTRQAVVMFLTRNGYLTKPSPPVTFTVPTNTATITVTNIPKGPPNVIARWIAFTEAGANGVPGAYFYVIPLPVQTIVNGQPFTYQPTVVNDNTTTTAQFSFIDSVLLSSLEIDITGGNQFNMVELGASEWNINYASRMFYGGEQNKITNFTNMSFNGGYLTYLGDVGAPLGWTEDPLGNGVGGSLITSSQFGLAYYVANATGSTASLLGMITQTAFQDAYKAPILSPNTLYSVRVAARIPSGLTTGNLVIDLVSWNSSTQSYYQSYGSFTVPFSSMGANIAVFSGTLLTSAFASVPSDLVLRVYASSIGNGADVEIDHVEVFPTLTPVLNTQLRASYVNNPEAFDVITGNLGVAGTNTQAVKGAFVMYDQLYLLKTNSMFSTQDTPGAEPSGWKVSEVSNVVGTCGINAYDVGEEWAVTACRSGLYVFYGRQPIKLSQEIFQLWDAINWTYGSTIWVKNDIVNRRILVGVPMATGSGTKSFKWLPNAPSVSNPTSPNVVLMLNYLGLGDVMSLADGAQMHTTMFGTLMSVDMRRKWTVWQIKSPNAAFVTQQDGLTQTLYLGNGALNGKVYQLLSSQLSDDGTAINSLYTTYGFVDAAKAAQFPLLGMHRKQWTYAQMLAYGAGNMMLKVYMNSLTPPQASQIYTAPAIALSATPFDDYERPLNAVGNRVYVQFSTNAVSAWFTLERLILVGGIATLQIRGSAAQ